MTKFLKIIPAVIIGLLPLAASAQSLLLKSPKTTYQVGDSFQVTLTLNTEGKSINTVSGKILVPTSKFQLLDVRYGNSIVSLWVERPKINTDGSITFSGGVPGGFSGSAGPILSFGVKAKSEGTATVSQSESKLFLNDGLGTEVSGVKAGSLKLTIKAPTPKGVGAPTPPKAGVGEVYIPPPDTAPPESFIPLISRHPTVADNKYFVSFFAVDKDSGISQYDIHERPRIITRITTKWDKGPERGETPYVLKIQHWPTKVIVRAYDQAGNMTEGIANKPPSPQVVGGGVFLLVVLAVIITRLLSTRGLRKPTRSLI